MGRKIRHPTPHFPRHPHAHMRDHGRVQDPLAQLRRRTPHLLRQAQLSVRQQHAERRPQPHVCREARSRVGAREAVAQPRSTRACGLGGVKHGKLARACRPDGVHHAELACSRGGRRAPRGTCPSAAAIAAAGAGAATRSCTNLWLLARCVCRCLTIGGAWPSHRTLVLRCRAPARLRGVALSRRHERDAGVLQPQRQPRLGQLRVQRQLQLRRDTGREGGGEPWIKGSCGVALVKLRM
eukprot:167395-Chlamydomonas_euryale.AAC.1